MCLPPNFQEKRKRKEEAEEEVCAVHGTQAASIQYGRVKNAAAGVHARPSPVCVKAGLPWASVRCTLFSVHVSGPGEQTRGETPVFRGGNVSIAVCKHLWRGHPCCEHCEGSDPCSAQVTPAHPAVSAQVSPFPGSHS